MKKILFDDVCYSIDFENKDLNTAHHNEFYESLKILLTEKQHESFVKDCRNREFKVRDYRVNRFIDYFNGIDNTWHKNVVNRPKVELWEL